jgi:hypothetical protein
MRKLLVVGGGFAVVLLAASLAFGAPAKQAPETAKIDDCVAKRVAVEFPHAKHVTGGIACATCHHTQADLKAGTDVEVPSCGSCHSAPEKATTPKCAEMGLTKNPFHISCLGCHKETVAKDATKKAPTKCDDCHPKS